VQQREASVQADRANIEAAQAQLGYTTIKAPCLPPNWTQ